MAINALRAHVVEFGVIAPQGPRHIEQLVKAIEENTAGLPELARSILRLIVAQLKRHQAKISQVEARLAKSRRGSEVSRRLATVPGVGIMGASTRRPCDPASDSGRRSPPRSASRANSSRERLGRTSKRGDKYIRCLLVAGAVAVLRHARGRRPRRATGARHGARKPAKVVAVRAGQPNGAHRLGGDGTRRGLPSQAAGRENRRASSLSNLQPAEMRA